MIFSRKIVLISIAFSLAFACKDDDVIDNKGVPDGASFNINCNNSTDYDDLSAVEQKPINEFIYKGLNTYYLFRDANCDFVSPKFSTEQGFENFTGRGGTPEVFFEELTVSEDRFSWIVDDFNDLERQFSGESKDTGMSFLAFLVEEGSDDVFLVATRIADGSPASRQEIRRGDFFNRIDGVQLNRDNFNEIFSKDNFTLGKAMYNSSGDLVDTSEEVSLTKEVLVEGTVPLEKVLNVNGKKIGYLFYNGFIRGSENELNDVFRRFGNENIDDLILDLRYNGGGSVKTAIALASMITGQFNDEIIIKEQWNAQVQEVIKEQSPDNLIEKFVSTIGEDDEIAINSLNLSNLYVIMTKRQTASASELIINGLKPYINVVTIGDGSVGKSQGSITLYDSPDLFNKDNVNSSHKYAMQPLVFRVINSDNEIVPNEGLVPDIEIRENIENLGILGTIEDPLFKRALDEITGEVSPVAKTLNSKSVEIVGSSQNPNNPLYQQMYK